MQQSEVIVDLGNFGEQVTDLQGTSWILGAEVAGGGVRDLECWNWISSRK